MRQEPQANHEIFRDQLLKFPVPPSLISKRFNPFEKKYEKLSDKPTIRYSIEEIPESLIDQHQKICHSQGSIGNPNVEKINGKPKPDKNFWFRNKTIKDSKMGEEFHNRDILRTESKIKNSKRWLNSPYKIPSSNDSVGVSSRKVKGKPAMFSGFGFSENSVYQNSRMFGTRTRPDLGRRQETENSRLGSYRVFQNRVVFQGDTYRRISKAQGSFKNYMIIQFGGICLKLIQFISIVILFKLTFDFINECQKIKEDEYFYFSSNSLKYINELFLKGFKKSLNLFNLFFGFVLFIFSFIHRYLLAQMELVEEAYIVFYELEEKLFNEKIIDKTFFDEEFFKMEFFNRKKIFRIRRYLYQLINTDPRILIMRNRTNLQLFVLRN